MASSRKPFRSSLLFFLLIIVLACPYGLCARNMPGNKLDVKPETGNMARQRFDFSKFTHAGLGSQISGMSELKRYLHRFGYLAPQPTGSNFNDDFDAGLKSAIVKYQKRLGLQATGRVDPDTVASFMSPRCGVRDMHHHEASSPKTRLFHVTKHYKITDGRPIWDLSKPMTLKYAFYPDAMIDSLSREEIRAAFAQAFAKWAEVIPVKFEETSDHLFAQVRIGFYKGDHGDEDPFDGPWRMLVHAFPYPSGELHLDAEENWAVNFKTNRAPLKAFDLESVAIHEIGHVLGLGHSSLKESIMYPITPAATKKVDLSIDDVEGIQSLYGPNPDFKLSSLAHAPRLTLRLVVYRAGSGCLHFS
ncbi:hypothetical protein CDL15_Pgr028514 [Punica granatum]|uniref:Peptidase metallopeptidase domain-containing protein n=1 Tax=Punica granatum TaxID=22663 RepID=A0A218VW47_PUNGR|nr:hypothetical protein CDL15_Pgr028514 [Punica granatum]PKI71645.1 hypothetical protein CRG98_007968 [Punica granatum]